MGPAIYVRKRYLPEAWPVGDAQPEVRVTEKMNQTVWKYKETSVEYVFLNSWSVAPEGISWKIFGVELWGLHLCLLFSDDCMLTSYEIS